MASLTSKDLRKAVEKLRKAGKPDSGYFHAIVHPKVLEDLNRLSLEEQARELEALADMWENPEMGSLNEYRSAVNKWKKFYD